MSILVKAFIQSITIMLLVSIVLGIGFSLMTNWQFGLGLFFISIILQFIFGYYHNINLEKQNQLKADEVANIISTNIIKNADVFRIPTQLTCSYCNAINNVPLSLIETNGFRCITCNQPNGVLIQYTTTRVTQPLALTIDTKELNLDGETIRQTTINEPITVK